MNDFPFKAKDRADLAALVLCLFALFFWVVLLSYKFFHFGYYDWDLAFFSQAMWNLCQGHAYISLFDTNFFSNHANLIAFFVLPVFKIFPHPLTLVFLKVISYVTAAFVLYILTKERLDPGAAILILALYLTYLPNVYGIFYEFDFESLSPALLMLIYYFYVKENWQRFLISAGFLVLVKENMPLIILAFSIHGLFTKKDKIHFGVIPGVLSLVSLYILAFVFIPHMSGRPIGEGHPYYIAQNYKDLGGSLGGVLSSIVFHPIKTWHYAMALDKDSILIAMFMPLAYLPFASPGVLFLISPILLQHLLSSSSTEHYISYAYVLTMAPIFFLAAVETLRILYISRKKAFYACLILLALIDFLIFFMHFEVIKERFMLKESLHQTREMVHDQWELVHMVPRDASVLASFAFLGPLSQRKGLYAFYKIYDPAYQNRQWSYKLPADVNYALIDSRDPWLMIEKNYAIANARAQEFLTSGNWGIIKQYGRYILYKKDASKGLSHTSFDVVKFSVIARSPKGDEAISLRKVT